tara:strand:+ start:44 stop:460 length:417 start_codon:yes stop_codon:yes gene_type:complete
MIDTDKYEGHTPAPWVVGWPNNEGFPENAVFIDGGKCSPNYDGAWSYSPFFLATASGKAISEELGIALKMRSTGDGEFDGGNTPLADVLLMADAPLLLAEVKRLRDELKFVVEMLEGKPSNMEWYECRNLILEQVVIE